VAAKLRHHVGHEHPEAVERHAALADALMPSDYAILYWLNRIPNDIKLFDYGGNMGNVYYSCCRYIDVSRRSLQWTVYDLPQVIEMAKRKSVERDVQAPHFTDSILDAVSANVLLVSSAFHYWERSTESFLEQFSTLPEHVFVNRSPFYNDDRNPVVSVQAGLNFAFPIIIRNAQEVLDGFAAKGYKVMDRWTAAEYDHTMPFFPDKSVAAYSGFYFRLGPS
jgi:putative methyltransferase (TIGR04325 family)